MQLQMVTNRNTTKEKAMDTGRIYNILKIDMHKVERTLNHYKNQWYGQDFFRHVKKDLVLESLKNNHGLNENERHLVYNTAINLNQWNKEQA